MYYIYSFLAVIGYALTQIIAKKIQLGGNISPLLFISVTMSVLLPLSVLGVLLFEKPSLSSITYSQWSWMIICGIINLIAFILLVTAIKYIPVAHYQIIGLLMPIFGGAIAYFWFAEKLSVNFFIGFIFICIGLVISLDLHKNL